MRSSYFLLFSLLLMAQPVSAAVSISEVAWMGSVSSANHEWIELHNDDTSFVSVEGWTLKDGMNFSITLSGSIPGSSYAVLERTSEVSSAAPAFLIYTGALVNTGATLTLAGAQGAIIDQVAGGTDWKNIGGDNTTKETAQYYTTGWVTDTGTPGASNRSGRQEATPDEPEDTDNQTPTTTTPVVSSGGGSQSSSRSSKSSESIRLKNPEIKLNVLPDVQSIAYEYQPVPFNVRTSGIDDGIEKMVRYYWNFGDSYTGEGKNPTHSYSYPGTYVVTVKAEYKKNVQTARHELTVLPVDFSLTKTTAGDIQVHNDAKYDVDISGYTLRGSSGVTFPPRTIMSALGTVTISGNRIHSGGETMIGLYDTKGRLVTSLLPTVGFEGSLVRESVVSAVAAPAPSTWTQTVATPAEVSNGFGFGLTNKAEASEQTSLDTITIAPDLNPVDSNNKNSASRLPYYIFISILLLAVLSLVIPRTKSE